MVDGFTGPVDLYHPLLWFLGAVLVGSVVFVATAMVLLGMLIIVARIVLRVAAGRSVLS